MSVEHVKRIYARYDAGIYTSLELFNLIASHTDPPDAEIVYGLTTLALRVDFDNWISEYLSASEDTAFLADDEALMPSDETIAAFRRLVAGRI